MAQVIDRAVEEPLEVQPPAPVQQPALPPDLLEGDEAVGRQALRQQIARMEKEMAALFASAFPRGGIEWTVPGSAGPRLLSLGELESIRDTLAERLGHIRGVLGSMAYVEERNRDLIEEMTANPERYRWVRVSNEDIGEPGCRHWHSRPRLGPLGMLMGWWRVKVSSGCP